jgi:hypothetical protein
MSRSPWAAWRAHWLYGTAGRWTQTQRATTSQPPRIWHTHRDVPHVAKANVAAPERTARGCKPRRARGTGGRQAGTRPHPTGPRLAKAQGSRRGSQPAVLRRPRRAGSGRCSIACMIDRSPWAARRCRGNLNSGARLGPGRRRRRPEAKDAGAQRPKL